MLRAGDSICYEREAFPLYSSAGAETASIPVDKADASSVSPFPLCVSPSRAVAGILQNERLVCVRLKDGQPSTRERKSVGSDRYARLLCIVV
jgi:hypothetical protein